MSILAKLKAKKESAGFFAAIGGLRLAGKSTVAGTLPGSTLLVQPAGIEAGNTSPQSLAEKLGNTLDMVEIDNHKQIFEVLEDKSILEYDNIYFDGMTAFTELVYNSAEFATKSKANKWDGFDYIKDQSTKLVVAVKTIAENNNKNVFLTYALQPKYDANGNMVTTEMESKGNATKGLIEGKCPNVVAAVTITDDQGKTHRRLITKNTGPFSGRLGNLLDEDNPGKLEADLGKLLKLVGRL